MSPEIIAAIIGAVATLIAASIAVISNLSKKGGKDAPLDKNLPTNKQPEPSTLQSDSKSKKPNNNQPPYIKPPIYRKPKSINDAVKMLLRKIFEDIEGTDSVYLIDLIKASILSTYPEEESMDSKFFGIISASTLHFFEEKSQSYQGSTKDPKKILQLDITTDNKVRTILYRLSSDFALCIIGEPHPDQTETQKILEEARIDIIALFEHYGLIIKA